MSSVKFHIISLKGFKALNSKTIQGIETIVEDKSFQKKNFIMTEEASEKLFTVMKVGNKAYKEIKNLKSPEFEKYYTFLVTKGAEHRLKVSQREYEILLIEKKGKIVDFKIGTDFGDVSPKEFVTIFNQLKSRLNQKYNITKITNTSTKDKKTLVIETDYEDFLHKENYPFHLCLHIEYKKFITDS